MRNNRICFFPLTLICAALVMTGCARKVIAPAPVYDAHPIEKPQMPGHSEKPEKSEAFEVPSQKAEVFEVPLQKPHASGPQTLASLQLTDQGKALLARGQYDQAISILERAVSLNPNDGKNYYYLARAWKEKGNFSQAVEFNRLAATYLGHDPIWMRRVKAQERQIHQIE